MNLDTVSSALKHAIAATTSRMPRCARAPALISVTQLRHRAQGLRRRGREAEEFQVGRNLLEEHVGADLHRAAARARRPNFVSASFSTIAGFNSNGAIMHYRVTNDSNRAVGANELLLVDSGAQYLDGTTDITRTIAIGDPGDEARSCYTRVLQGTIAISRVRWPSPRTR